jgi:enoyl-CoA hydratase
LRVIVFTGSGDKAFVSGADIGELARRNRLDALRRINGALFHKIERFPVPTIAAIRGVALGGGCELAMACDLRVCGRGAKLGQPEVALGIIPGAGGTYRLPRLVGLGRAKDLIFTGRLIDAEEALRIGLVNLIVDDDEVVAEALELARRISRQAPLALRLAKIGLDRSAEMSTEAAMALESASQAILFETTEKQERMEAFSRRARRGRDPNPQQP